MKKQLRPEEPSSVAPPQSGAQVNDQSLSQQFANTHRASNEAAIAQLANQQGAGVKEWQTPSTTPPVNQQAAAQAQRSILNGDALSPGSPERAQNWQPGNSNMGEAIRQAGRSLHQAGVRMDAPPTPSTYASPQAEVRDIGQRLNMHGVQTDSPALSGEQRAAMEAALARSVQTGQNAEPVSRMESAAREMASRPSAPEEERTMQR